MAPQKCVVFDLIRNGDKMFLTAFVFNIIKKWESKNAVVNIERYGKEIMFISSLAVIRKLCL